MKAIELVALVLLFSGAAFGSPKVASNSIFGIASIGEKFALKQCAQSADGKYIGFDSSTCYEQELILAAQDDPILWALLKDRIATALISPLRTGMLHISFNLPPALIAKGGILRIQVIEGVAEYASFDTAGVFDQDTVLAALKIKYGEPDAEERENIQNAAGAKFTSIAARWAFENLMVLFQGTNGRTDRGMVTVATQKGIDFEAKIAKSTSGPKL
jgi:hypothetical protein